MQSLSIIIVTYNSANDILPCLDSIYRTKETLEVEIYVVDNASHDVTTELVQSQYPNVSLIINRVNAGFPGANNQAIRLAKSDYILLLNPDTIVRPGALQEMVTFMDKHQQCGICGPILEDENGREANTLRKPTLFISLVDFLGLRCLLRKRLPSDQIEIVSGACLMFRKELIANVGLLDERMHSYEDADYCVRVSNIGCSIKEVPMARVLHLEGRSARSNVRFIIKKQILSSYLYYKKHSSPSVALIQISLLCTQILIRYVKWAGIGLLQPSEEGNERIRAFKESLMYLFHDGLLSKG